MLASALRPIPFRLLGSTVRTLAVRRKARAPSLVPGGVERGRAVVRERVAFPAVIPLALTTTDALYGVVCAGVALALLILGWRLGRRAGMRQAAGNVDGERGRPTSARQAEWSTDQMQGNDVSPPLRVEGLLEEIPDSFFVMDADWVVVYANPAATSLLRGGDPVGRNLWDTLPEPMQSGFRLGLTPAMEERRYSTFEKYFDPPGRWLEVRGYPNGEGLAVYIQDIGRRKWAEEDLRRTKESLTHAQELAHVGSWDYEGSSDRYTWSDETYRIMGYAPGEISPSLDGLMRVVHPDDREGLMTAIVQGSKGVPTEDGQATPYEHRVVRDNGEIRIVRGVVRVIPASPDRPSYVVGAVQDITDQRKNEEALRAAVEDALRANRAKSELLSRTSHELRTPLNAILGFGQLLEMEAEGEENRESVEQILRAGKHLLRLVDEVLDIARAEGGRLIVDIEPLAPDELVREAVAMMTSLAQSKQVELRPNFSTFRVGTLLGDRTRLLQVLLNLLSNAIKYNRVGGLVEISCDRAGDRIRLTVRDTGVGIEPATMERLFLPFQRGQADEHGVDGTGLGLALSRSFIEAMQGRIWASATPGEGSTFWIELPALDSEIGESAEAGSPEVIDQADLAPAGPLVLYIEDSSANFRLMELILTRHRPWVRLIHAARGRLGIELAKARHPDLVLLDLNLPDIMGTEVLTALQTGETTRRIPVVMVTGEAVQGQERRLLELGATAYVSKPFQLNSLLELVDSLLSGLKRSTSPVQGTEDLT